MGDCLRRAYDEAERAASRGDSNATQTRQDVADLKAENAKLRKMARQMYPLAKACLQFGVTLGCIDTMSYDWALQMTELGIEVDDG